MFDELTDDELYQIYTFNPQNEKIRSILKEKKGNGLFILRDESLGEYWKRKFANLKRRLTREEIDDLLTYREFPCAKGKLGEAAMSEMIDESQCEYIMAELMADDWAYKQLKALSIVNDIKSKANEELSQNRLDELLSLKTAWAVIKILKYLNKTELIKFQERLSNSKNILTKSYRHEIIEIIKKLLNAK